MCREDSGDILSDDITDLSDCPGQSSNDSSHQDTNTSQLMEESETVAEEPEMLVVPQVVPQVPQSHGVNWTAVDVYKIFHQFNRSSPAGKETDVILQPNISATPADLNQTLVAIKRTNITTNITTNNTTNITTNITGDREKRSAGGSAFYQAPLHISREDDISVLSVSGADPGLQYHSM